MGSSMETWNAYKAHVALLWEHSADLLKAFDGCDWAALMEAERKLHAEVTQVIMLAKELGIQPPEEG